MNKYLSTVGLYARWNLYRILVITLVTAALAGVLVWRYPVGTVVLDENYVNPKTGETTTLVASYPRLASVAAESRATIVCAVGFTAVVVVMSLTGCGYGVRSEYTVRRLRVKERRAVFLWAAYHAVLLVIFWAAVAAAVYGAMTLRLHMNVGGLWPEEEVPSPQSLMMLCYTDPFMHHLLPLRDAAAWASDGAAVLAMAFSTVLFSYRQRRGRFSVMVLLALGGTIASFFCGLGEDTGLLLLLILLGVAGFAYALLLGGDGDAA